MNTISPTLHRDFYGLLIRRRFWILCAACSGICAILFFSYLENFLNMQAVLRAKNFRHGVTDLVLAPYLKTTGYTCVIFMTCLCAKLFHNEHFSPFSKLYRTTTQQFGSLIISKYFYIFILTFFATFIIFLPIVGCGLFFDYNISRVALLLTGIFILLLCTGAVTMVLSQVLHQSILVVLLAVSLIVLPEIATKLLTDPAWLTPIIAFFSPISHMNRIASGIIAISDVIFFISLLVMTIAISRRQFCNSYLLTN